MDGHLSSLKEYQAEAEAARQSIEELTAEQARLKRRLSQQQEKIGRMTGELDEKNQLVDAIKARSSHAAARPPAPADKERHSCKEMDDLRAKLAQSKTDHTDRIKQKNVLIQTLRRQLKGVSDKLVAAAETDSGFAMTAEA